MKKLLLTLLTVLSLSSFGQRTKIGNVLTWPKIEGNGIYYRVFLYNTYILNNKVIVDYSVVDKVKDTMFFINFNPKINSWYEYKVQAIDSLGTKSEISNPVFFNRDSSFVILHTKIQDVYDTTTKIIYKYLYDTIVKYDTVVKIKYNITYNKSYDTVKFEYPIDTLTYTYTNIIDINVTGSNIDGYRVEYFDLTGRLLDKNSIYNQVFIIVVYDSKNDIIDIRKVKKLGLLNWHDELN